MTTTKEEVAAMKSRIDHMEKQQDRMFEVVKEIKQTTDEHKGARKALHAVYIIAMGIFTFKFGAIMELFR